VECFEECIFSLAGRFPLPNLATLALTGLVDDIISAAQFDIILRRLPNIRELKLKSCLSPRFLGSLGQEVLLPNLKVLTFYDHSRTTIIPSDFATMLSRFPALEQLNFTSCHPALIRVLTSSHAQHPCPRLEGLSLNKCPISGSDLLELVRSRIEFVTLADFRTLRLADCICINEVMLGELGGIVENLWVNGDKRQR